MEYSGLAYSDKVTPAAAEGAAVVNPELSLLVADLWTSPFARTEYAADIPGRAPSQIPGPALFEPLAGVTITGTGFSLLLLASRLISAVIASAISAAAFSTSSMGADTAEIKRCS
jgi:hypothetical protein